MFYQMRHHQMAQKCGRRALLSFSSSSSSRVLGVYVLLAAVHTHSYENVLPLDVFVSFLYIFTLVFSRSLSLLRLRLSSVHRIFFPIFIFYLHYLLFMPYASAAASTDDGFFFLLPLFSFGDVHLRCSEIPFFINRFRFCLGSFALSLCV